MRLVLPRLLVLVALALSFPVFSASPDMAAAQGGEAHAITRPPSPAFFAPPSMDLSDFRFRCFMFSGRTRRQSMRGVSSGCGFGGTSGVCDEFQASLEMLQQGPGLPTRPRCLATCKETRMEVSRYNAFGCYAVVRDAWRTCTQYCRSNFPDSP